MRMKLAWLLLLPLGIATGCDGDDFDPDTDVPGDDDDGPPPGDDDDDDGVPDQARIRVVHLARAVGDLDLQVERAPEPGTPDNADEDEVGEDQGRDMDDRAAAEIVEIDDIAFATATSYVTVRAGTRDLFLYPSNSNQEVLNLDVQLQADQDYTLIVWGDQTDAVQSLLVRDDRSGITNDEVRLSLSNVSPVLGELDWLDLSNVAPMLIVGDQAVGTNDSSDVDDDIDEIGLDLDDDLIPDLEFDLPDDIDDDDLIHLIAAEDAQGEFLLLVYPNGDTVRLNPRDGGGASQFGLVRFLNLDVASRDYDLWVGDCPMPSVTDSRFLSDTDYIPVRPGTHTFRVIPRGSDVALLQFQLDVLADRLHSATWYAVDSMLAAITLFDDDDTGLAPGDFRVQFANLIDGVPVLDIYRIQAGPNPRLVDDAEFDGVSVFDLDADRDHRLGLDLDNDGDIDLAFDLPDVAKKGEIHNLYAIDFDPDDLVKHGDHKYDDDHHPEVVLLVMHTPDGKVIPIETEAFVDDDDHHYPYGDDDAVM